MSKKNPEEAAGPKKTTEADGAKDTSAPLEVENWDDVTAEIKRAATAAQERAETFMAAVKKSAEDEISPEARAALLASAVGVMRGFQKALKSEADRIEELRLNKQHQPNEAPKLDDDDDE